MGNFMKTAADAAAVLEQTLTTQAIRSGQTSARVASCLAHNIAPESIALMMTQNVRRHNSDAGIEFDADDVRAIEKLYRANKTRCALPRGQARAAIRLQESLENDGFFGSAGQEPEPSAA